jgi:hypothetical protein
VNVNVDFYEVEQKLPQLFFETPELQMEGKGPLKGADTLVQAHRSLINEITGPDFMNVLEKAVKPAIKDCLAVSGVGPVILGYQPTLREVQPPMQPGSILGLNGPVQVPIYQQWYALRFSPKKLLIPADWHDKPGDDAPWLGMRFRMPLTVAIREKLVPAELRRLHGSRRTCPDQRRQARRGSLRHEVHRRPDAVLQSHGVRSDGVPP